MHKHQTNDWFHFTPRLLLQSVVSAVCAVLATVGCCSAQDCDGWVPLGDPSPRRHHGLVFDSHRGVLVMTGGEQVFSGFVDSGWNLFGETWEFDGHRWTFRTLEGPGAIAAHASAFDPSRGVTVVFGGGVPGVNGSSVVLSRETWEWDGAAWQSRNVLGPAARCGAAMAYDPVNQRVLLHGGSTVFSTNFNTLERQSDLWAWDGQTWNELQQSGDLPGAQAYHTMVFDPSRGMMIMLARSIFGETQTFGYLGGRWVLLVPPMPGWTTVSSMAFDPISGRVQGLFPSVSSSQPSRFMELRDGDGWVPITSFPPAGTIRPESSVLARMGDRLLAFGISSQVSEFAQGGWRSQPGRVAPPMPTLAPAIAFDASRAATVLLLSQAAAISPAGPTTRWELRGETWHLIGIDDLRVGPIQLEFDPARGALIGTERNSAYLIRGPRDWQELADPPSPRFGFTRLAFDRQRNQMTGLVFNRAESGVYALGTPGWTRIADQPSSDIRDPVLAFDIGRNALVALSSACEALRPSGWEPLFPAGTLPYGQSDAVFDPSRPALIAFGGFTSADEDPARRFPRRTVFLSAAADLWSPLPIAGPMGRKLHRLIYDPSAERVLMYGGYAHGYDFRETWKLARGPARIALSPSTVIARTGRESLVSIVAKGGGVIRYQWRRNGEPLEDRGRYRGTHTDTLVISDTQAEDAGQYTVSITNACGSETSPPIDVAVRCPVDINADGQTDADDLGDFVNLFFERPVRAEADFNADGHTDADDLADFINAFFSGLCS